MKIRIINHEESADQRETEEKMKQRASHPVVTFDAVAPGKPEDQRRGKRPEIASRRL